MSEEGVGGWEYPRFPFWSCTAYQQVYQWVQHSESLPPFLSSSRPPRTFLILSCPPSLVHVRTKTNTVDTGAYGAHGLSDKSDKIRNDWKTATQYQLLHAVALATLPTFQKTAARTASGVLFSAGITLFSGSVYAYGERVLSRDERFLRAGGFLHILLKILHVTCTFSQLGGTQLCKPRDASVVSFQCTFFVKGNRFSACLTFCATNC